MNHGGPNPSSGSPKPLKRDCRVNWVRQTLQRLQSWGPSPKRCGVPSRAAERRIFRKWFGKWLMNVCHGK